jgi:hypothetical protein
MPMQRAANAKTSHSAGCTWLMLWEKSDQKVDKSNIFNGKGFDNHLPKPFKALFKMSQELV